MVELSSAVGGLSKELEITDLGNGSHEVKYIPEKHGEYILKVQIDGGHIVGSPFICRVTQCTLSLPILLSLPPPFLKSFPASFHR